MHARIGPRRLAGANRGPYNEVVAIISFNGTILMTSCFCILAGLLLGQSEASGDDPGLEIHRLVRQLDADQLAAREAAEAALMEMGPDILGHLPRITDRTSEEVKLRLGRIQQRLQQAAAEKSVEASRVSLSVDARPLSEVLAALSEQSGNRIVCDQLGPAQDDPPVTLEVSDTPLFEVLDRVLDQAGMTIYPYIQERAIDVRKRSDSHAPAAGRVAYAGPFRIEPTAIAARRDLRDATGSGLRLSLAVSWEPRIRPINVVQKLTELSAVDENSESMLLEGAEGEMEATVGNSSSVVLELPLRLPPRNVKKIARLDGKLVAMVPGRVEEFRFGDLSVAKNVSKRVAGVTVTLNEVRRSFQLWEFLVSVQYDEAGDALESYRGWIFNNEAYLEDRDGKRQEIAGLETIRQTENMVQFAYRFALAEPLHNYRLVYKTPSLVVATEFDYALKDIELP